MIVGYEPATYWYGAIASMLLGASQGGVLVYVGSVGTGFKDKECMTSKRYWMPSSRNGRPRVKGKPLKFVERVLAAEIEYRTWNGDGKLRHASYKRLRDAGDPSPSTFLRMS